MQVTLDAGVGHERGRHARAGARAVAPLVLAYAPFALVVGSTAATIDAPLAGWAGSWLVYGGSAHLVALHGIADGTTLLAVATALLVNSRLLVYGASLAPQWRSQPLWFRLAAPALVIDSTWALADRHGDTTTSGDARRGFFLGVGLTLGVAWSALIGVGVLVGSHLPDAGLGMAAPLCLAALVGPRLKDAGHRRAAITAGIVAAITWQWPASTGTLAAIVAGTVAGASAKDVRQP